VLVSLLLLLLLPLLAGPGSSVLLLLADLLVDGSSKLAGRSGGLATTL
jgi:hypothetical protein